MCPSVDMLVAKDCISQGKKWADDNYQFIFFSVTWKEKAVWQMFELLSETSEQNCENESVSMMIATLFDRLTSGLIYCPSAVIHGSTNANACLKETFMSSVHYAEH